MILRDNGDGSCAGSNTRNLTVSRPEVFHPYPNNLNQTKSESDKHILAYLMKKYK